ncbi:hypothetical protein RUND412_005627, partial [Rhizina undulata]
GYKFNRSYGTGDTSIFTGVAPIDFSDAAAAEEAGLRRKLIAERTLTPYGTRFLNNRYVDFGDEATLQASKFALSNSSQNSIENENESQEKGKTKDDSLGLMVANPENATEISTFLNSFPSPDRRKSYVYRRLEINEAEQTTARDNYPSWAQINVAGASLSNVSEILLNEVSPDQKFKVDEGMVEKSSINADIGDVVST